MHQLILAAALICVGGAAPAQPEPLRVPTLNGLVEALETSYPLTADKLNAMFFATRGRLVTVREHWLAKHRLGERCTDDMLEAFVADPDAASFGVPKFWFTSTDGSTWSWLGFRFQARSFPQFSISTFFLPTCKPGFDSSRDILDVSRDGQYCFPSIHPVFWSWGSVTGAEFTTFPVYGPDGCVSGYFAYESVAPHFVYPHGTGITPSQRGYYVHHSTRPYRFQHWDFHDFALNSQFVAPTPWFPPGSSVPVPRVSALRGGRDAREITNDEGRYQWMANPFKDLR